MVLGNIKTLFFFFFFDFQRYLLRFSKRFDEKVRITTGLIREEMKTMRDHGHSCRAKHE